MPQAPQPRISPLTEALVSEGGLTSVLNISAPTVVRAARARLCRINVTTAGTAPGAVYDADSTSTAIAANVVMTIPNATGITAADWPCANGITITPGAGQTVSVSFL